MSNPVVARQVAGITIYVVTKVAMLALIRYAIRQSLKNAEAV